MSSWLPTFHFRTNSNKVPEKQVQYQLDRTRLERDYDLVKLSKCLGMKKEERRKVEQRIEQARHTAGIRANNDIVELNYCDSDGSLIQATFYDDDAGVLAEVPTPSTCDEAETLAEMESLASTIKREEATLERDIYKCGLDGRCNVIDGISYGIHYDEDPWYPQDTQPAFSHYESNRDNWRRRLKVGAKKAARWAACYLFGLLAHAVYIMVLKKVTGQG